MDAIAVKRIYTTSDAFMLSNARSIHTLFGIDQAQFEAFDKNLDPAFGTAFGDAINDAEAAVSDDLIIDIVAAKTEAVEQKMNDARNKYGEVRYFVLKAFPDSKATQGQFGLNDYEDARKSAPKMLQLLNDMKTAAASHSAALISAGYTAAQITSITTVRTALEAAESAQKSAMKSRVLTTEERVKVMNTVYDMMTQVNAAAQIVFMNDYAKRSVYVFDASADNYDGPGVYEGTLTGGQSVEIAHLIFHSDRLLILENPGTTSLQYYLNGGGLDTQGSPVTIAPGASDEQTMADLDATGTHLIVKNLDAAVVGSYKVTVGAV
jgi:hypothetical protein